MAATQPVTVVWDDEQPVDHAGAPVAPLTPAGMPYRWRLRLPGRSLYAVDADQVLAAVVVVDYPSPPAEDEPDSAWEDFEQAGLDARVLHAFGVIVDHVAQAMINGVLDPDAERVLQRSASRGPDNPPITLYDCPEWSHEIPMILIKDLYNPDVTTRQPPRGNVVYIDPGVAETYLLDLARLDVVDLEQNPAYRSGGGSAEIVISAG
ncbi:MAG: hypothetical protein L0H26_00155 [Microlunatus sp.]|nr:hypothetical protein [Microlunatus sp.]